MVVMDLVGLGEADPGRRRVGRRRRQQGLEGHRAGQQEGHDTGAEALDADQADQRDDDGQDDDGLELEGQQQRQDDALELRAAWKDEGDIECRAWFDSDDAG